MRSTGAQVAGVQKSLPSNEVNRRSKRFCSDLVAA